MEHIDHPHEQDKHVKKYHFFVDGNRYDVEQVSVTGAEIKVSAAVDAAYQLFLEETGNAPDRQVSDGEAIELDRGTRHFYAVPPATFGAA